VSEGTTTPPGGGGGGGGTGSNTIVVRAKGTAGSEQINVRVDNTTIGTFTLTTGMANYTASTNNTGNVNVQYFNDASGRDVQVDYVTVNGATRQAENQSSNTAVYQNGACGGSNSEMMHCNGIITFGAVSGGGGGGGGGTTCNGYYALTFDDGPTSNTNTLLGILSSAGVKATFFPMGNRISSNLSAFQAMVNAGHKIQNHSFTHSHMLNWTYQQVYNDLQQAQQAIQNAGGGTPTIFRPPYGEVNSTITSAANALGLRIVTWSVDSQDWNGASTSSIVSAANNLQNGGVILMHDGYSSTNNAVSQIVNNLKGRNLCAGLINSGGGVGARMITDGTATGDDLEETLNETVIKLYPNPVTGDKFTVEVPEGTSEVRVADFSGRIVKTQAVAVDQRKVDLEVNTAPGFYILKAINRKKSQNKKFIIK
jgi:peptidoglycan/xylan/chitin deacetylase (PgdA/CDA1 family)